MRVYTEVADLSVNKFSFFMRFRSWSVFLFDVFFFAQKDLFFWYTWRDLELRSRGGVFLKNMALNYIWDFLIRHMCTVNRSIYLL